MSQDRYIIMDSQVLSLGFLFLGDNYDDEYDDDYDDDYDNNDDDDGYATNVDGGQPETHLAQG